MSPLTVIVKSRELKFRIQGNKKKSIKLFSFVEFCLWNAQDDQTNFQRNFSTGEVEIKDSVIYHKTEYKERRNHYSFYSVNTKIDGFDTDRDSFIGLYNGFDKPDVVLEGTPKNSHAHGWSPIGSHYLEISLKPNEEKEFNFILGYVENDENDKWDSEGKVNKTKALQIIEQYSTSAKVEEAFMELKKYWDNLLSVF